MTSDKLPSVSHGFSHDEKLWLLSSLELKRLQLNRALNSTTDGSAVARAINEDMVFLQHLMTKVGLL